MAPFRPTNLNKRAYPGNANVIGPTRQATIGFSTTVCCSCISNVFGATSAEIFTLGCRCTTQTCPFCHCCCCCNCTVCTRTTPSGMWNMSEQYEARKRDAWGPSTCSAGAQTGYCSACCGTCSSVLNDCKGFYVCCGAPTKWFVAPSCTEVGRCYLLRTDSNTQATALMGACSWFVPTITDLGNAGFSCRAYWDTYTTACPYWSNTENGAGRAAHVNMLNGVTNINPAFISDLQSYVRCIRSFRTV